jgi:hypothetical protein
MNKLEMKVAKYQALLQLTEQHLRQLREWRKHVGTKL